MKTEKTEKRVESILGKEASILFDSEFERMGIFQVENSDSENEKLLSEFLSAVGKTVSEIDREILKGIIKEELTYINSF